MPEHLALMDEDKKWDGLIRLLQSQRDEIQAMNREIQDLRHDCSRMADEVAGLKDELKDANGRLAKVEEIRLMAIGGKAAFIAVGGAVVWLIGHALDFVNKGK